jgi:aminoglycoside 6'-N-acetyltransferase I
METEIVRVGPGEAQLLARVADDVFDAEIDPRLLAAYLAAPGHLMVLAVSGGVVVGQGRAMVHASPDQPPELYIDNMGVAPPRQREGIGGRLLDELMAWGREHGCAYAWLGTETDNEAAHGLYGSRGGEPGLMTMFEFGE